jgi:hypothetical protein
MINTRFVCLAMVAAVMLKGTAFAQESPGQLLQAGFYAEEIKGDLQQALTIYQKIIKEYPDQRPVAAKAQLHVGLCYEKLGQQLARAAFQKVLENYPDQREVVAVARERLAHLKKSAISPLVKYYFERLGIDITTSTSHDGKYLAYTDWTTGSLMIADLGLRIADDRLRDPHSEIRNQRSAIRIVEADLSNSSEYAYYPAWSRDGKFIAYGWYRGPYFVELRVVSVADGKIEVICSDPKLMIMPDDWSPDGKTIACETLNFDGSSKRLALVRVDRKELQDVLALHGDTRRVHFSPDGKYVAYNLARHLPIYVLSLEDLQQTELTVEFIGITGYDGPVWSPDGNLILCRNVSNQNLLAMPVQNGRQAAKSYLIQTDLTNALLIMKGIKHPTRVEAKRTIKKKANLPNTKNAGCSFEEEFSSPVLDSAWSVFEWKGPNVYDYPSFGRYSLADRPGHLRYYLDPIMFPGYLTGYLPRFGGWYWSYPSLEISRPLAGDNWLLEAKATYRLVDGANGRNFELVIFFDPERERQTLLQVSRGKDIRTEDNLHHLLILDKSIVVNESLDCISSKDTLGLGQFTYLYRITRADTLIQGELSDDDGKSFQRVFSASLRPELRGLAQLLVLTGWSWFVPAGSYVDWDYVRFRNLDFPISDF